MNIPIGVRRAATDGQIPGAAERQVFKGSSDNIYCCCCCYYYYHYYYYYYYYSVLYYISWARKPRGTNHGAENTTHLFMMRFTTCFWKSGLNLSPAVGGALVPQWCRNLPPPGLHPLVRARMNIISYYVILYYTILYYTILYYYILL